MHSLARLLCDFRAVYGPRRLVVEMLGGVLAMALVGLFLGLAAVML